MIMYIKLAWRNMWRNWRRSLIAMVAIVLGLVLLLFFDGFIAGSDQAIYGNAVRLYGGNIQAHDTGYREKARRLPILPLTDADAVVAAATAQPEVVSAAKRIKTAGIVSSPEGAFPVVINADRAGDRSGNQHSGRECGRGTLSAAGEGDAIFIGRGLADLLEVGVGERVNVVGRSKQEQMRQRTMTIVGIYDIGMPELEKGTVFMTLAEAQDLYNLRDQVTEVAINLQEVGQEANVMPALVAMLPGYDIDTWDSLQPEVKETLTTKLAFTTVIGLIVIIVASIGILNIQLMAVFERTREMGVLAALGMKGRQIMGLFLLEGTFIGALGAFIGCLAGVALHGMDRPGRASTSPLSPGMGEITALMGDRLYPYVCPLP